MIELNGIQISDNNINTRKNVKIYVDKKQLDSKVGELSGLKTTDKSSIVNAINEVKDTTNTIQVNVNRIYSEFTIIPNTPTEQEFTYKQSNEGVIEDGVAVIDKVKGNSVVWNQLMKLGVSTKTDNGITYEIKEDGRVHIFGTATARSTATYYNYIGAVISGHKYIVVSANNIISGEANGLIPSSETQGSIVTCNNSSTTPVWFFRVYNGVTIDVTFRPQLVDITQMFGAGNEPTTYEEFLSRKPKVADEYAYNEGTIVNNKVEKMVTTGRNLFDSSTSIDGKTIIDETGAEVNNSLGWCSTFIPIIGGESYFCKEVIINTQAYGVHYYDKDKQHINGIGIPKNGRTFDAPISAKYIRIHGRYADTPANTAILSLSDASFNGQYAPYEKHELDLSWIKDIKDNEGVKLFEDGMKSVGTAYDEVQAKKLVKRIEVVDLGELEWQGNTAPTEENGMMCRFFVKPTGLVSKPNYSNCVLSPKFSYSQDAGINPSYNHTCFQFKDGRVFFNIAVSEIGNTYSTDAMKIYMQGVPLYYELAEPIEVEYDEKNLTYPVIAGGTEEAITSEPSTPMRASITYGSNTVATILSLINRVNELERKIIN